MRAVLVHGVPDTHELWDEVRGRLERGDVVALDLPGFGCPRPEGFGATKEEYLDWLVAEVEAASAAGPVDLVGHDWGSLLVQRLVTVRPDLVRTWAAGGAALEPSYVWHDFAQAWQRPETGTDMVPFGDETMKQCILDLYRSAVDVFSTWGEEFVDIAAPGLVIWGADDPFVPREIGERAAGRAGAELLMLEGCGHFWPRERPADVAAALEQFWKSAVPESA